MLLSHLARTVGVISSIKNSQLSMALALPQQLSLPNNDAMSITVECEPTQRLLEWPAASLPQADSLVTLMIGSGLGSRAYIAADVVHRSLADLQASVAAMRDRHVAAVVALRREYTTAEALLGEELHLTFGALRKETTAEVVTARRATAICEMQLAETREAYAKATAELCIERAAAIARGSDAVAKKAPTAEMQPVKRISPACRKVPGADAVSAATAGVETTSTGLDGHIDADDDGVVKMVEISKTYERSPVVHLMPLTTCNNGSLHSMFDGNVGVIASPPLLAAVNASANTNVNDVAIRDASGSNAEMNRLPTTYEVSLVDNLTSETSAIAHQEQQIVISQLLSRIRELEARNIVYRSQVTAQELHNDNIALEAVTRLRAPWDSKIQKGE